MHILYPQRCTLLVPLQRPICPSWLWDKSFSLRWSRLSGIKKNVLRGLHIFVRWGCLSSGTAPANRFIVSFLFPRDWNALVSVRFAWWVWSLCFRVIFFVCLKVVTCLCAFQASAWPDCVLQRVVAAAVRAGAGRPHASLGSPLRPLSVGSHTGQESHSRQGTAERKMWILFA